MHGLVNPLPRDHEQSIADDHRSSSRGKGLMIRLSERLRDEGDDVEAAFNLVACDFLMNRLLDEMLIC